MEFGEAEITWRSIGSIVGGQEEQKRRGTGTSNYQSTLPEKTLVTVHWLARSESQATGRREGEETRAWMMGQ
jgi:hypothetical protein